MSTSSSDSELIARPLPKKRVKQLAHSIEALPISTSYTRSYKGLRVVCLTVHTETGLVALATASGKLELRQQQGGELHLVRRLGAAFCSMIRHMRFSCDGKLLAVAANNGTVATIDTQTVDIIAVRERATSDESQTYVAWLENTLVAAAGCNAWLFDQALESTHTIPNLHRSAIKGVVHSMRHNCIVSWDESGMIEVWDRQGRIPDTVRYKAKSETDLFLFRKTKRQVRDICVAKDALIVLDADGRIVVLDFASGKRKREYDETLQTLEEMQKLGTGTSIDPTEFSRRVKTETKEGDMLALDVSSSTVVYPTILGVKALSLRSSTVTRVFGSTDNIRFHQLGLVQFTGRQHTLETAAAENSIVEKQTKLDSAIITLDSQGDIYLFGNETKDPRDVSLAVASADLTPEPPKIVSNTTKLPTNATLHTSLGDITFELYPKHAPLAVENFTGLCRQGYYNGTPIKSIRHNAYIRMRDPGDGGQSIWQKPFKDEASGLTHEKYVLGSYSSGPDSNGSQFIIVTGDSKELDFKSTIFGKVVSGFDIVDTLNELPTRNEVPLHAVVIHSASTS